MLQLISVFGPDGKPVILRTYTEVDTTQVQEAISDVLKEFSFEIRSSEIHQLDFRNKRLLLTQSEKGYLIVGLTEKTDAYLEGLLRVIRIAIDEEPDVFSINGAQPNDTRAVIDRILDFHIPPKLTAEVKIIDSVWPALVTELKQHAKYTSILSRVDDLLRRVKEPDKGWLELVAKAKGTLFDALKLALEGQFDQACAICFKLDDPLARLFAIKLGLLALSTTHTAAPPLYELRRIAETLPLKLRPFAELAYAATLYSGRLMSYSEYLKIFQSTAEKFEFRDHEDCLIFAFFFIDTKVVTIPEFAQQLASFFQNKSPVVHNYIIAMIERNELFKKLYSITSYNEFKDKVSIWKNKISDILDDVNKFLKPGFLKRLLQRKPEAVVTDSLNLGTYIALYTALAESPVLNLRERREVLEEVLTVYTQYFKKLLGSGLSLFSYTIDSVFQSISVVLAELHYLLPVKDQAKHVILIKSFLEDILSVLTTEWIRESGDISTIFVMTNAIFPVLFASNELSASEIELIYLAMRLLDKKALKKHQQIDTLAFLTNLLNIVTTLGTLTAQLLYGKQRQDLLERCVTILIQGHKFFLAHGVLCRDDIGATTLLTSKLISEVEPLSLPYLINSAIMLNRVAVPDAKRNESEIAVLATSYLELLFNTSRYYKEDKYQKLAKVALNTSLDVWQKFGYISKAREFKERFGFLLE